MKKSFILVAFATLSLFACNNSAKKTSEINQEATEQIHGHSHDGSDSHTHGSTQNNFEQTPLVSENDSIGLKNKEEDHGHQH